METWHLDPEEQRIVTDAEWILRKNNVIQKAYHLFAALQQAMAANAVIASFPGEGAQPPKISRGEQYLGLPYVVLDYPRLFHKEEIFACRTFFWWGRFFSITLHLADAQLERYRAKLLPLQAALAQQDWHICINDDPWQHHFENDNYRHAASVTPEEWALLVGQRSFVKLSRQFNVLTWEKIIPDAVAGYAALLGMLNG